MHHSFGFFFGILGLLKLVVMVAAICAIVAIARAISGPRQQRWRRERWQGDDTPAAAPPDEQEVMERLIRGLDKMEQRIQNLETILK